MRYKNNTFLADDDTESLRQLFKLRFPSLVIGLFLGLILSFITSRFEEVIAENPSIAFFIPLIVYLADAIGTQTQAIYARDLEDGRAKFSHYLIKETKLGIIFGSFFALISALIIVIWFNSLDLAAAVSISLFGAVATAPVVSVLVTEIFSLEHSDPAAGAGPIATAIQDTISVVIYGFIASAIIL